MVRVLEGLGGMPHFSQLAFDMHQIKQNWCFKITERLPLESITIGSG
jgi:hypothetical protein